MSTSPLHQEEERLREVDQGFPLKKNKNRRLYY
jgi:hypothetical protein